MRVRFHLSILACLAISASAANSALAEDAETRAIRAASKEYVMAKHRGDLATLRQMWTSQGEYVDASGQVFEAQELLREQSAPSSAESEATDIPVPKSILRFITPNVAIEDGSIGGGTSADGRAVMGRFMAVWVKRDGRWLLDSLRESIVDAPPMNEHLQPLEWLVGEWAGTTDAATVLVSADWSDGGNYLVREFLVRGDGGEVISGTERIGWDAASGEFKSWTFDSQGGRGEGRWRRDGEQWIVESRDVLADGKQAATSAVYRSGEDGHYVWEVRQADLAGEKLPSARIEFHRAAED